MPSKLLALLFALASVGSVSAQSPRAERSGVEIRNVAQIPRTDDQRPIRIAQNPADQSLYVLATSNAGSTFPTTNSVIYRLDKNADGTLNPVSVVTDDDHGTPRAVGMVFGPDGSLYLVGNQEIGEDRTRFVIRRGTPSAGGWTWATVATSAPYLLSRTFFDHRANALAVSPDGSRLILNSGARTDHGESYGGVREEGLTALLLQIPADATDLTLPNDRAQLRDGGYLYAEGIRNTADLAYAPNGDLIGPENAGDRDDSEELNWLREGAHYGFPWRIGMSQTPMQFAGYDPENDPFVQRSRNTDNTADTGWYFSNDPTYPMPPQGVEFVDPIANVGPFADLYRDAQTGAVVDASDTDTTLGTFTGHRSPLGLVFDADSVLADDLKGSGFVVSFNGTDDGLLARMNGTSEDLIALDLDKSDGVYTVSTRVVASGFDHPVDAAMVGNVIYVIEFGSFDGSEGSRSVYSVTLPRGTDTNVSTPSDAIALTLTAAPNPTQGAVTLTYSLPTSATVRLEIVDALGRIVKVVRAGEASVGSHSAAFSADGLPNGLYLVRLTADGQQRVRLLTVLR